MRKITPLILIAVFFISGCDSEPPQTISVCLEKESRVTMVPKMMAPGMPSSGGFAITVRDFCIKSETRRNPAHDKWLERQEQKDG